ncbi:class I SAM-dependent RNA methyltransferase [Indioceanicola profundi]|uniref:hypothetical protein n=1 Tax=Indioceanicola profundi TaxID=2220096 RepID=UPI00298EB36A|nr:hypothetical protein [Indioceanicola profundi]
MTKAHRRQNPAGRKPEEPPTRGPVEITVGRVGARGDGVAEWQGHRLFVPQALAGDRLMARFGARRSDGWEAVPVSLIEEAPGRAEPACRHFGTCGGCALQHMDDAAYVAWTAQVVETVLSRAGLLEGVEIRPLVRTPAGGRRRAVLSAAKRGKRQWLGFNERASHRLVDVNECLVLGSELDRLLEPLRELLAGWLADGQTLDVALTVLEDGVDLVLEGGPEPDLAALEALAAFAERHDLARLTRRPRPGAPAEPIALRRQGIVRFGDATVSPAPALSSRPAGKGRRRWWPRRWRQPRGPGAWPTSSPAAVRSPSRWPGGRRYMRWRGMRGPCGRWRGAYVPLAVPAAASVSSGATCSRSR